MIRDNFFSLQTLINVITKDILKTSSENLDLVWKSIDIPPKEEGFYVVARFDECGNLKEYSDGYVYIEKFQGEIIYNGGSAPYVDRPTHYMLKRDFKEILSMIPKEDVNGELVL